MSQWKAASIAAPQVATETPAELQNLAVKVFDAYRRAKYISFEQRVTAPPLEIECFSEMAEGRLATRLYIRGKLAAVVTFLDGRIEEIRPEWVPNPDRPNQVLRKATLGYDSPGVNGTDGLVLRQGIEEYLCLVGSNFQSWIGKYSEHPSFLRDRILAGRLLPPVDIDGHLCTPVAWDNRVPGYHRRDVFYFDSTTFFWRRWQTYSSGGTADPVLERTRDMTRFEIQNEIPRGKSWTFKHDEGSSDSGMRLDPPSAGD